MRLMKTKHFAGALLMMGLVAIFSGQASAQDKRGPTKAIREVVVLPAQSLADVERKIQLENKTEELIGGAGMELRVAVQHEKDKAAGAAELHDASDDVYYVLEGSATLVLGGTLENPRVAEPGEWRSPRIVGGKTVAIHKGDLVIVPRGTPHQRSTVGQDFTMLLIKVYAEPLRAPAPKPASAATPTKP